MLAGVSVAAVVAATPPMARVATPAVAIFLMMFMVPPG